MMNPWELALDREHGYLLMTTELGLDVLSADDYQWVARVPDMQAYLSGNTSRCLRTLLPLLIDYTNWRPIHDLQSPLRIWPGISSKPAVGIFGSPPYLGLHPRSPSVMSLYYDVSHILAVDIHRDRVFLTCSLRPKPHPPEGLGLNPGRMDLNEFDNTLLIRVARLSDGVHLMDLRAPNDFVTPSDRDSIKAACVDTRGRLLVLWYRSSTPYLLAFSEAGSYLGRLALPWGGISTAGSCDNLSYDARRGYLALASENRFYVLDLGQWLPRSFTWQYSNRDYAPPTFRATVLTVTCIRSLEPRSCLSSLPNELLFEIFSRV